MADYRAYILRPDGHVQFRVDPDCQDEAQARAKAKLLVDGFDVELWELDRLIERFKEPCLAWLDGLTNNTNAARISLDDP